MRSLIILLGILLKKTVAEADLFQFGLIDDPEPPEAASYSNNDVNLDEMVNVVYVTQDPTTVYVTVTETVTIPLTTQYVMVNNPKDVTITTTTIETQVDTPTTIYTESHIHNAIDTTAEASTPLTTGSTPLTTGSTQVEVTNVPQVTSAISSQSEATDINKNPQVIDYSSLVSDSSNDSRATTATTTASSSEKQSEASATNQPPLITSTADMPDTVSSNFGFFSSYVNDTATLTDALSPLSSDVIISTPPTPAATTTGLEFVIGPTTTASTTVKSYLKANSTVTGSRSGSMAPKTLDFGYDDIEPSSTVEYDDEFTGFPQFNELPTGAEYTYINESSAAFGPFGLFLQMALCMCIFVLVSSMW